MNIVTKLLRRLLKIHETEQKVQDLQAPVDLEVDKTVKKIQQVNKMLMKTKTYYIGKAMGVIR